MRILFARMGDDLKRILWGFVVPTVGMAVLLWQGLRGGLDNFGIAVALGLWVVMMYGNSAIMDARERRKRDEEREEKLKDTISRR